MLEDKARWVRQQVLEMVAASRHGHLGGSFSCVEILVALYSIMRPQDRFILSKGHAAATLYAVLADKGVIPVDELRTFCQEGSRLEGHPNKNIPGVIVTTGSLGHGLGIGAGLAWSLQRRESDAKVFVLMGDGECQEGSVWEAMMFANHQQLGNLIAIVDCNGIQATDRTKYVCGLEPFADKWRAFGWNVITVDGHDLNQLEDTFRQVGYKAKPTVVIADTVKGKGVPFMENSIAWHHRIPNDLELCKAREQLHVVD